MTYTAAKVRKRKARHVETKNSASANLVTFDRFYETVEENVHADLLDGKIIRDSPAAPKHGLTTTFVAELLGTYVSHRRLGFLIGSTSTVRLTAYQAPEPDLFFISAERHHIINEKYIDGPPDLCIEVISKSSRRRDRVRKFVLYADHGVREYWIIDPLINTANFYRNVNGEWQEMPVDDQGVFRSEVVPGFWMKVSGLFIFPPPDVHELCKLIFGE
jgi:Uma2 family endonuclease